MTSRREPQQAVRILTLGRFGVLRRGRPVRTTAKPHRRPVYLLKALISFGGVSVSEARLIEALWPAASDAAAYEALSATIPRLRALLGPRSLERHHDRLGLNPRQCWVDVWAFERLLEEAGAAAHRGDAEAQEHFLNQALKLYHGPFLAGDLELSWQRATAERLRARLQRHLGPVCDRLERSGQAEAAIAYHLRVLDADDCAEESYQRLMNLYVRLGRHDDALRVYHRCHATLSATLGVPPSWETQMLARTLRSA